MGVMLDTIGKLIAGYLQKEVRAYEPFTPERLRALRGVIEPATCRWSKATTDSGIIKDRRYRPGFAHGRLCRAGLRRLRA